MWYGSSSRSETPAVYVMLATFVAIFLMGFFAGVGPLAQLMAWQISPAWLGTLQLWRPLTFPFLHTNIFNLIADGLVLYFFGGSLERAWGSRKFLIFFFLSGIVAGVSVLALSPFFSVYPVFYGMAGSFVAVVVAFAALNPYATVILYVVPVQARWLAAIAIALELFGYYSRYGNQIMAVLAIGSVCLFAWIFATRRIEIFPRSGPRTGLSLRERLERWRQKRRMRSWQRRVSRIDRPDDLFKK